MIDMHSHILPKIDDGSKSMEETIRLINEAKETGFEAIVTTPHYIEGHYDVEHKKRLEIIDEISKELSEKNGEYVEKNKEIKIYLGNEIYLADNMVEFLKDGKASTINGSNYVLFEMPFYTKPMNLYDIIYEMLQYKYIPILAHPERYVYVQKNPKLIEDLIKTGVYMQANFGSIVGQYGYEAKRTVKKLLKNNQIHFMGTDCHKECTVYKNMPQILKKLKRLIGEEKLEEITSTNPKLVLNNKNVVETAISL